MTFDKALPWLKAGSTIRQKSQPGITGLVLNKRGIVCVAHPTREPLPINTERIAVDFLANDWEVDRHGFKDQEGK